MAVTHLTSMGRQARENNADIMGALHELVKKLTQAENLFTHALTLNPDAEVQADIAQGQELLGEVIVLAMESRQLSFNNELIFETGQRRGTYSTKGKEKVAAEVKDG